ncbi:hypothetical protein T552_03477 [Pneumocystis carinii B80]|uniref:Importin N-terminal domain-containing protein n=1 Tax=Pneumocystis carinii (strain B80) TaxID=1408658 RepID=A0A0W4ZBF1_PNEC8|nr:hypothetical protein T552_03477 [Pneumocystis carinii B80]KTW25617.1 hypothetical protein T552_03477 [Pneumocystis carinii B80]
MEGYEQIIRCLQESFNPLFSRQVEKALEREESRKGFVNDILRIVSLDRLDMPTRQAACVLFKNFIRKNWGGEGGSIEIEEGERIMVKKEIVMLMISVPPLLQVQIGECISIIAEKDFPGQWDRLIDELVSHLSSNDMVINQGILQTAHSIFGRWRGKFRSDLLFSEILFVLEKFSVPYRNIFLRLDELIMQNSDNKEALELLFKNMILCLKIFYDLNCQDLPEFFEDNIQQWMGLLHKYMNYSNPLLISEDQDIEGPLEKVRSNIYEIVELYTQRYEDAFSMLPEFVNASWNLLTNMNFGKKNDILVEKIMMFLTSVVKIQRYSYIFKSQDVLGHLIENIVLPNISFQESDKEFFEDDSVEYVRRDLEEFDCNIRRNATYSFVRALLEQFETDVVSIVSNYISRYLLEFQKDKRKNWRAKNTAIYLFFSITIKGSVNKLGITSVSAITNVVDFFSQNIFQDLSSLSEDIHTMLKVVLIKYVYIFRNQLQRDQILSCLPLLMNYLNFPDYAVYTYSAVTIEAILNLNKEEGFLIGKMDIVQLSKELLENLFKLIEKASTLEKLSENDFLMKCTMRVIATIKDGIIPLVDTISSYLINIILEVSKNPSNPKFNHYVFESLAILIRYTVPNSRETLLHLENLLFPSLRLILQNDVVEFIPYVFQILAQLLEYHNLSLPDIYKSLVPPILLASLWESRGNVPALVRFLKAVISQDPLFIVNSNYIEQILGIFQKLNSSRLDDHYGFELLETVFLHLPASVMEPYIKQIFLLLLTRLNQSRTEKFTECFIQLIFFLSAINRKEYGPDYFINVINNIQTGLFEQVFLMFCLPGVQNIKAAIDRKTCSIGMIIMLCRGFALQEIKYPTLWSSTLIAILKLFELPFEISKNDEIIEVNIDDIGFQASFSRLAFSVKAEQDPCMSIKDPKAFLIEELMKGNSANGGNFSRIISTMSDDVKTVLTTYGYII